MPNTISRKKLFPLYAKADETVVQPILDALKSQGFPVAAAGKAPNKRGVVLLFLSEKLSDEPAIAETFFRLDAKGFEIIPINLDGTKPPELIENALYSRNTIFAERYSTEELINRIASAQPLQTKKSKLPILLAAGAAVLLTVAAIVLIVKLLPAKETVVEEPEPTAAPATAVPTPEPVIIPEIPGVDAASVLEVVYVGDQFLYYTEDGKSGRFGYQRKGEDEVAYRTWENNSAHYYSKEDGHELPFAELGDLSYLHYLINLRYLTFANVSFTLPDLSDLSHLNQVQILDCSVPDLEGLRGSQISGLEYASPSVTDFSPLTGCASLRWATLALYGTPEADFSGFCPPALENLTIMNGFFDSIDLSGLSDCKKLKELYLDDIPVTDLSILSGCSSLSRLQLNNLRLRDLSGLETLGNLKSIQLETVEGLRNIDAIGSCTALEEFMLGGYASNENLRDVSVLGTLPKLNRIELHTANIDNLDFLNDLTVKEGVDLSFSCDITDFSGLASIRSFKHLHVNMHGRDYDALAAPHLENVYIVNLELYDCSNIDLSTLPKVSTLSILHGTLTSLEGLSMTPSRICLENCQNLLSLDGIQNIGSLNNGTLTLEVTSCPRLSDWSALDGAKLMRIELDNLYSLPDFGAFNVSEIRFGHLDEELLPDLSCLNALDEDGFHSFDLREQQNINDLTPLFRFKGDYLIVPPQVEEQAKELVNSFRFRSYEVGYPDGSWNPNDETFTLLSFDELEALPKSILKHVNALSMAGDLLYDSEQYWVERDWVTNPPTLYLRKYGSDESERIPIETGTLLTDLIILKDLTGLKRINLYAQSFETLEGIQYLDSLEELIVNDSPLLSDVSAAFTLPNLIYVDLDNTSVASIQGIQNLWGLTFLSLDNTDVKDFSPLGEIDWSYLSESDSGLWLQMPWRTDAEQFAYLSGIPRFSYLDVSGAEYSEWGDALSNTQFQEFECRDNGFTNDTFRAFCEAHPEIARISVSWSQDLTDVSPALSLPNLRYLRLSNDMQEAIDSLGGSFDFALDIE